MKDTPLPRPTAPGPAASSVLAPDPAPDPADVLAVYDAMAEEVARARSGALCERRWLDRALAHAPGRSVLDLGCGAGRPIATYLAERRCRMTGVDGAAAACALYGANVPGATVHHGDMRALALGARFDLLLAWESLCHLIPAGQRAFFATLAAHAAPRAVLLFTTGPRAMEAAGDAAGVPVYCASLDAGEYRTLLAEAGFELLAHVLDDSDCPGHTVWMARFAGPPNSAR